MLLYCLGLGGDQKVTLMLSVLLLQKTPQCSVSVALLLSCARISHDVTLVIPGAPLTAIMITINMYICVDIGIRRA